jgi:hypothetical protein
MLTIPQIRPVSDLRNSFSDISREDDAFQAELYRKLKEAEIQAESTVKRYSHGDVMNRLQKIIDGD